MNIVENVPLKDHSTMRLGGNARYLGEINSYEDLTQALYWAAQHKIPVIMIGTGSNIVWKDEGFQGLVLVNKIHRFEAFDEDEDNVYLTVGAGENWDSVVERVTQQNLSGIQELSLVPGTVGATPIQNVGAYGREIADVLVSVEAFDIEQDKLVNVPASECKFSYRSSRFKIEDKGRFLITAITLHLSHTPTQPPFHPAVAAYFEEHKIVSPTPKDVRDAVVYIRKNKLPDPAIVANSGSFFTNPIIDADTLSTIQINYPSIKYTPVEGGMVKVAAAWLIEEAGFRGISDKETGISTWPSQSLILVNESAHNTADLLRFKQKIVDAVKAKFQITLVQEPELLP
jgi:UDP-N-acetylmuramate dehydrogenase